MVLLFAKDIAWQKSSNLLLVTNLSAVSSAGEPACSYIYMNKAALAELIHGKIGGTKTQSEEVVQMIIDGITSTLKKGDEVSLAGLGIFSVKDRAAREARNPKTGETVKVAATRVPKFRAAKALKDAVK